MPSPSNKKEEINSAGYPRIERLVDSENFDEINKTFTAAYDELDKISRQKAGLGKSKQAKKAMKAYQLTMELLKEVLGMKYQMIEAQKQKK